MDDWNSSMINAINGMVSAGAALAQNLSISNTGPKDRKFMEEQNALNYEHFLENRDWQYEKYLEAREYDSPAQQRQRLLDAGLNPAYYMAQNQNSSAVSSVPSVDTPMQDSYGYSPGKYLPEFNASLGSLADRTLGITEQVLRQKQVKNEIRKLYRNEDLIDLTISNLQKQGKLTENQAIKLQYEMDETYARTQEVWQNVSYKQIKNKYADALEFFGLELSQMKCTEQVDNLRKVKSEADYAEAVNELAIELYKNEANRKIVEERIKKRGLDLKDDEWYAYYQLANEIIGDVANNLGTFVGPKGLLNGLRSLFKGGNSGRPSYRNP